MFVTWKIVLPEKVKHLAHIFWKAGAQIYVVGGAVRDLKLGRKVKDWDFTTNLTPEKIQELFPKNSFYNNKFGTVTIVSRKKELLEVTTFRKEGAYSDRRHPDEVSWGKSIEDDLSRRDFTINAMALSLKIEGGAWKTQLIDPFQGEADLKARLIRAVGEADKRFGEDALRMMRAVRIASQIGFFIEDKTYASILRNAGLLDEIAQERIRDEFLKILQSKWRKDGMSMLYSSGLLERFLPELARTFGVTQAKHHIYDVWTHSMNALAVCQSMDPIVLLATLIHDIGKPMTAKGEGKERTFHNHEMASAGVARRLGRDFRLSRKEADKLYRLVRWHQFTCDEEQTDKAIRRFVRHVSPEYVDEMIELRRSDRVGSGSRESSWRFDLFKKRIVEVQKQPFTVRDLKINGHELMSLLKVRPGPVLGKILNSLFKEIEEGKGKNQKSWLKTRAKELFKEIGKNKKR